MLTPHSFDHERYTSYYEQELVENRDHYVRVAATLLPNDAEDLVNNLCLKVHQWPPGHAEALWAKGSDNHPHDSARALLITAILNSARSLLRRRKKQTELRTSAGSAEDDPFAGVQKFDALPDPASLEERPAETAEAAAHLLAEAEDCFSRILAAGQKRAALVLLAFAHLARKLEVNRPPDDALLAHLNSNLPTGEKPFKEAKTLRYLLFEGRRALVKCMAGKGLDPQF